MGPVSNVPGTRPRPGVPVSWPQQPPAPAPQPLAAGCLPGGSRAPARPRLRACDWDSVLGVSGKVSVSLHAYVLYGIRLKTWLREGLPRLPKMLRHSGRGKEEGENPGDGPEWPTVFLPPEAPAPFCLAVSRFPVPGAGPASSSRWCVESLSRAWHGLPQHRLCPHGPPWPGRDCPCGAAMGASGVLAVHSLPGGFLSPCGVPGAMPSAR